MKSPLELFKIYKTDLRSKSIFLEKIPDKLFDSLEGEYHEYKANNFIFDDQDGFVLLLSGTLLVSHQGRDGALQLKTFQGEFVLQHEIIANSSYLPISAYSKTKVIFVKFLNCSCRKILKTKVYKKFNQIQHAIYKSSLPQNAVFCIRHDQTYLFINYTLDGECKDIAKINCNEYFDFSEKMKIEDLSVDEKTREEKICYCRNVSKYSIEELIRIGINDFETIRSISTASTVCGSCKPRILKLMNKSPFKRAYLYPLKKETPNTTTFRLHYYTHRVYSFLPGQYINIKLNILGKTYERSFTLTSKAKNCEFYEVTIKDNLSENVSTKLNRLDFNENLNIQMASPEGNFIFDQTDNRPIVFITSGIGITPAISFLRDAFNKMTNFFYIDYSIPEEINIVKKELFDEIKKNHSFFKINYRYTKRQGVISDKEIVALFSLYKNAKIYCCGSPRLLERVTSLYQFYGEKKHTTFITESFELPKLD